MPAVGFRQDRLVKAVGAYIFAGGFTLGLKKAGFDVTHHLEDGQFGVKTAAANFLKLKIKTEPKRWLDGEKLITDLVFCNPPCSPWSTAGIVRGQTTDQQTDWRSHMHSKCVARSFSLMQSLRPLVWTFESVRQVFSKAGDMLDEMSAEAASMGYKTYDLFVEAKNHGVPQHRKRYFMVCSRVEIDWEMPVVESWPTVYEKLELVNRDDDFCGKTPSSVEAIIQKIGQGENARMVWDRMVKSGEQPQSSRPAFIYDRMAGDRPSYTLLGSCNKMHPDEDRMLSVNETKVLCGFPPEFKLIGSMGDRYAQLGKGVCPPVAEWLGKNLMVAIRRKKTVEDVDRVRVDVLPTLTEETTCRR